MFVIIVFATSLAITTCSLLFAWLNHEPIYLLFTIIGSFVSIYTFIKTRELFILSDENLELSSQFDENDALPDDIGSTTKKQTSRVVQSTRHNVDETARIRRPSVAKISTKKSADTQSPLRKSQISELELGLPSTDFIFAAMCHEIRTPLNGVIGMIELLLDTKLSKKQRHITQTVFNSSQVLSQVLNDYVLFFRAQAGEGVENSTGKCNIEETVLQVALLFQGLAFDKKIDLVVDIADDVPTVIEADPRRLQQIIGNLTLNALKYTREGEVCIGVRVSDDLSKFEKLTPTSEHERSKPLEFYISDSGPGLTPEEVSELFVPFRRLKSSQSTTGSGLGLTICKIIARSMNANIDVDSELDVGTTFSVYFQPLILPTEPQEIGELPVKKACVYGGEMGSSLALITYLEQLHIEVREGHPDDLKNFDPKKLIEDKINLVFAFTDELGDEAANFYERAKVPVCRVRWLSDPSTFDYEYEYTLVRPFSRFTILELISGLTSSECRLSTVDRWRSTFAEKFPLRIAVAEDDPVSLEVLVGMLQKLGFSPQTAKDGEEAVRLITTYKPDLAIIDMHMPGCTGLEVIERCRETPTWWVVASAGSSVLTKENSEVYGYNDLLTKPLNIEAVRNAIQRAGESLLFDIDSVAMEENQSTTTPYEQMRELYADDPERLESLLNTQIEQTDDFIKQMSQRIDDPLAAEDVRRMAHTLRSSASFAGAITTASIAEKLDKEWDNLELNHRSALVRQMRLSWENRERHQLVNELNNLKR